MATKFLKGVRVLDLTNVLAGPSTVQIVRKSIHFEADLVSSAPRVPTPTATLTTAKARSRWLCGMSVFGAVVNWPRAQWSDLPVKIESQMFSLLPFLFAKALFSALSTPRMRRVENASFRDLHDYI